MTRKNLKILPVPFTKGLNTEALSPILLEDGECSATSNLREIYGSLSKRYGINKIGTDETMTATGLAVEYFGGAEKIGRAHV